MLTRFGGTLGEVLRFIHAGFYASNCVRLCTNVIDQCWVQGLGDVLQQHETNKGAYVCTLTSYK